MIVTFTDFGVEGPYLGQVRIVLHRCAPGIPVVDLVADAPKCDPLASAYLLAALVQTLPRQVVVLGVVDPGVGTDRPALVVRCEERWFVGPDNGLFERAALARSGAQAWRIVWHPKQLSRSFHGRDLFAPVAARLALGELPGTSWLEAVAPRTQEWPDDLEQVIYVDRYGNCVSGVRGSTLTDRDSVLVGGCSVRWGETFGCVEPGCAFWHRNSMGLVEISVNKGSAARHFDLSTRSPIAFSGMRGDSSRD